MGSYSNAEAEQNTMSHKFCKNSHPKKAPSIHSFNQYSFIHSHIHLFKSTKKKQKKHCNTKNAIQKQPSRAVLRKRCSENMQQFTGEHHAEA